MFKEKLSEEAYLDFIIRYGEHKNIVSHYWDSTEAIVPSNNTKTKLVGYVSVAGNPNSCPSIVINEPSDNRCYIPVRQVADHYLLTFFQLATKGWYSTDGYHLSTLEAVLAGKVFLVFSENRRGVGRIKLEKVSDV